MQDNNISNKKNLPLIISMGVLAVAGLGFGGYEMYLNHSKNTEIDALKVEITDKSNAIAKLETEKIQITDPNGETMTITDSNTSAYSPNYLYFGGDWGIKIKIPENLKGVTYIYDDHAPESVCFAGVEKGMQYGPDFADLRKNTWSLGCLTKHSKDSDLLTEDRKQQASYIDEAGNYYIYSHPQAVWSTAENEKQYEVEAVQLIQEMLTKNVSKF